MVKPIGNFKLKDREIPRSFKVDIRFYILIVLIAEFMSSPQS